MSSSFPGLENAPPTNKKKKKKKKEEKKKGREKKKPAADVGRQVGGRRSLGREGTSFSPAKNTEGYSALTQYRAGSPL